MYIIYVGTRLLSLINLVLTDSISGLYICTKPHFAHEKKVAYRSLVPSSHILTFTGTVFTSVGNIEVFFWCVIDCFTALLYVEASDSYWYNACGVLDTCYSMHPVDTESKAQKGRRIYLIQKAG